jgi:membrane associated rhomboid family serine protease
MAFSLSDDQDYPRITPAVQWLIALNVAIFFLQLTIVRDLDMWAALGFKLTDLTEQPWTIVTYMFVHGSFLHLGVNMYMLWLFGPRIEHGWSSGRFSFFYVLCGLGGWLFHLLFAREGTLIGASGAIFGVMLAYAMRWPDDEITIFPFVFLRLKMKWLVVLLGGFNLVMGIGGAAVGAGVAYFAHLGGFAVAWLYLRWTAMPSGERLRHRVAAAPDVTDEPPRPIPRSQPRPRERLSEVDEVVARSNAIAQHRHPETRRSATVTPPSLDAIDPVLDKISRQGMDSLTPAERRLLEEYSKRLRRS